MIKKLIFGIAALFCMASCTEDYTDWSAPQSNAQGETQKVSLFTKCDAADINLGDVTADSIRITNFVVEQPEGYVTDSFSLEAINVNTLERTSIEVDKNGYVSVADLDQIVKDFYGVRPTARQVSFDAKAYSWTSAAKTTRVCSDANGFMLNITPIATQFASAYYYIGEAGQTKSDALKFDMKDGVLTLKVAATGGWHWFKVTPVDGFNEDGTFNWDQESNCICAPSKDDESTSGKYVIGGDKYSWHLIEDGTSPYYLITIDLYDQTYTIQPVAE